jgi:hypothetical protein
MLVEKTFNKNDTVTLKLTSGEELVGRYVTEDFTSITLYKPMVLIANGQGIGLGPYLLTVSPEDSVKFFMSSIATIAKTEKNMATQYVSSTTGISI